MSDYFNFDDVSIQTLINTCGTVQEVLYVRDLEQRKLFLADEITRESVFEIVKYILQFNKEDEGQPAALRKPILLYIASPGGSIYDGFEIVDAIRTSITPVYTINIGYWFSMGFLIGIAGHKRYAFPHSKFLLHDGSDFVYDSMSKVQDRLKFNAKVEADIKNYVLEMTNISEDEYMQNLRVEWYMFADEAQEKGCVDFVVGKNCEITEVI